MIYLDYNGQPTPATDLSWYATEPCGCASAVVTVAIGGVPIALSADQARLEINETKREAAKDKREYILAPRSEVIARLRPCTHKAEAVR